MLHLLQDKSVSSVKGYREVIHLSRSGKEQRERNGEHKAHSNKISVLLLSNPCTLAAAHENASQHNELLTGTL